MSGFLYRGRHCGADQRARPKSMMDFACGETDKGPPVQMHSLREFEQHLNDLKKENFSLKLRIYFLEEKIQQKFEESSDDVHKRNIELKVEVESLKTELEEKQELLDRALSTVESLSDQNEAELQRCLAERQEEISHMQEILETKVQLLQEEAELARDEAKRMATLANSEAQRCLALEREMEEKMEESEGSEGLLTGKERVIEELTQQKSSLHLQVEELEARLHNLSSTVEKHGGAKRLIEEQRGQLSHYESAAGRCVGELQEAQGQVRSLQAKIRESENRNQKLQQCLGEMELELRSAREEAQQQERNIQNMSDAVSSKEAEVSELYRVIEEQNKMLRSLKELVNSNQLQQLQASGAENDRGRGEVLALQASLFQAQLELEADQRAQRRAGRTQKDLGQALQRLESDLRGVLQYRREVERHNQELQLALEKARSALQEREEQLRDSEQERRRQTEERDKTVRELKTSLQTKDRLLEDYCEMLEEPKEKSDSLLQKLRLRIKERDRALERAVDEKFRCVEEMEEEARRLQLLLREKERDLERQRCVLANNEETITSLEALVRGKTLELEQVCDACRSVRAQQQESEERQGSALRERDAIIGQLQAALHARTQEAQDLQCSLLTQIQSAPGDVLEELKVRLQLKDRLFQEVLADRTHQAQEHQDQIQDLLRSLSARDQYIQECASRLGEVITEQTSRLQELRTQLSSGLGSRPDSAADLALELQAAQEELRLAMRREKDSQELSRSQAAQLDSLSRTVHMKEEIIRDLQRQMVDPQGLHLVERLTREVQELRERLVQEDRPSARGPVMGPDQPSGSRQPQIGGLSSEDEDEADNNVKSEYTEEPTTKSCGGRWPALSQDVLADGQRLMEVKQLVEQKKVVERELRELKAQLEKAGFSSLSQMRKALFSLQTENEDLKQQLAEEPTQMDEQKVLEGEEEEELDVTIEEEETSELWEAWEEEPSLCQARVHGQDERREERCDGQNDVLAKKTARLQHESQELQERLMVSEATVQAQAEQLKDYRDLLTETAVQQDSKQVQVDLQDLGYETCGRSENEAEREDASSPEFDDLEMCTSLDCSSQWWSTMSTNSSSTFSKTPTQTHGHSDEVLSLRRLVKDLRSQLSRSQGVICELQSRLHSLSVDNGPSTTCRVNWSSQASSLQSGAEDNEGWQSSDGARLASHPDKGIQELVSRMDALEDQLRKGSKTPVPEDGKSATWPGKFDTLIQAQARELSHLRQQLREGQGVCSILTQHLADTTKVFEELLRANDIDYYMGQSFREHLAQSSTLAQRVSAKISAHHSKDPDEKTELLAIRLSKELQQKDKVIESLRTKLNHHHHPHCFDTPCSSHALSDTTDQSDRISYMSDEHGSANEDLELCSDVDAASELGEEETRTSARVGTDCHSQSVPPSVVSFHQTPSCLSCPSMLCSSLPHKMAQVQSQTGFSTPQSKPLHGFAFPHHHHHHQQQQHPDPSGFLPLSYQQFHHSPFSSAASSSSLDASLAMKAGASLLESSALWDVAYGGQTMRVGADLSLGSSGYQSCKSHTVAGSELMKEHLREIRTLRPRLEDSIHANDRLRQQLEERLAGTAPEKAAPTNIYIQGLESVSQLSSEVGLLKQENISLQNQLKQAEREGSKEVEQLKEALLLERSRVKEAGLKAERWAEQRRKLQTEVEAQNHEVTQLKQDRLRSQETINRLQHEVSVLQQQLCESRSLVHSLQCDIQAHQSEVGGNPHSDDVPSPPMRDTGLISSSCPQHAGEMEHASSLQSQALCGSVENPDRLHAIGHIKDFKALQQQMAQGGALLLKMKATLYSLSTSQELCPHQPSDCGSVKKLLWDFKTLQQILEEANSLLHMFWRASLPNSQENNQDLSLRDEVLFLRVRLSEQEQALQDAMESVKSSNRTKDSMEHFIVSQLSSTRDVLRKAKTNLEVISQHTSVSSPSLLVRVS